MDSFEIPHFAQPSLSSRLEILETYTTSLEKTTATLGKMDDATITAMWTLTKGSKVVLFLPRAAFIRSILLNHV